IRKLLRRVQDMDRSGHLKMNKANELEIAGCRELYGIGSRAHDFVERSQDPRIRAHRTIEADAIGRTPRTAYRHSEYTEKRQSYLPRCQERHCMNLCAGE